MAVTRTFFFPGAKTCPVHETAFAIFFDERVIIRLVFIRFAFIRLFFCDIFPHIHSAGKQNNRALYNRLRRRIEFKEHKSRVHDLQQEHTEDNAADFTDTAHKRYAADHARRDGVEFVVHARSRRIRSDTRRFHETGNTVSDSRQAQTPE